MAAIIENQDEYFKVIEEQLQENKLVTFKWLSRKLKIHSSIVKSLMDEFIAKSADGRYVPTYLLFGKMKEGGLTITLSKQIDVTNLNDNNVTFVDKYIYCIEAETDKFDAPYIYDNDKSTYELDQIYLSSINYPSKIIHKITSSESENEVVEDGTNEIRKSTQKMSTESKDDKDDVKKIKNIPNNSTKSSLTKLFDNQRLKNATAENTKPTTNNARNDVKNEETIDVSKPKPTKKGLSRLFEIQMQKKANKCTNVENSSNNDGSTKDNENEKTKITENEKNAVNKSLKQNSCSKSSKSNKTKTKNKKKMKRILPLSNSSSEEQSSDEDDVHMEEGPEYEPEPEPEPEPDIVNVTPDSARIIVRGRKRKRKVVEKTVFDDDGYLRTSKEFVYESCESNEDDENNADLNTDINKRLKMSDSEKNDEFKVKMENNIVPVKNETKVPPLKTKQASIMSFFKKS